MSPPLFTSTKRFWRLSRIFVWHFYQVFFDPDVYPMNWAWWDGKMTLHHYREEHGLDEHPQIHSADEVK